MLLRTEVRIATSADWPAVRALLQENGLPVDGAEAHLRDFLVAVRDGELVGCAGAEIHETSALIRSVAVARRLHRRGIGSQLVERLLDALKRQDLERLFLLTVGAASYFSKVGFTEAHASDVPDELRASAEFQGACPSSAMLMTLTIDDDQTQGELPVAVLGAGPVGMAAAAKLLDRGMPFILLEAASQVGASLLDYGHVRLFSPWRYNIDPIVKKRLLSTDWQPPPDADLPLAREVVEQVLQPFAELPEVARHLLLGTRVVSITREGFDKVKSAGRAEAAFVVQAMQGATAVEYRARAVIDATGTWNKPNPLGSNGLPAIGERDARSSIFYGVPDVLGVHRARFEGKRTLVVGAGHSAANTLLDLAKLARDSVETSLIWWVRSPTLTRVFGGGEADALPARGRLGSSLRTLRDSGGLEFFSSLRIQSIERHDNRLTVSGSNAEGITMTLSDIDQIVCATGQRPDLSLTSELRLRLDPLLESTEALGPLIDPNVHSCGTVRPHGHRELAHPEPGFYTIGVKSYGRAPTFLMATGFEQARSVVAAIAGDLESADRVELDLPATGVCGIGSAPQASKASAPCCGSSNRAGSDAPLVSKTSCQKEASGCAEAIVRDAESASSCC